jgi:NAD+ synthase (glutamine-hydrolysing)
MLRLGLLQVDVTVGAIDANVNRLADACAEAARAGCDLAISPELAVSGYPPEDLVLRPAFLDACQRATEALAGRVEIPLLVGTPWLDGDRVRNSAALLASGRVAVRYDKQELPNYGVFDEERTFAAGTRDVAIRVGDALCGLTICEDVWIPEGVMNRNARGGATVILNLSSSPYHVGKGETREEMLRTRCRDELCFLVYCNLVGGQDELVFDGRSVVIDPDGTVVARAAPFAEEVLVCDVDAAQSVAARLRDTRPRRAVAEAPVTPEVELPARLHRRVLERRVAPAVEPVEADLWGALVLGLRDYVEKNGFQRVLIGLSGGIDSALVAALAADALGPERVEAISMPTRFNASETRSDAERVAANLGIGFRELAIEELRAEFLAELPDTSGLAAENLQARIRGVLLMTVSNQHGHLVLTTSNKSETAVGYSTLYGDSAGGFAPIKDVPKTMVFRLARWLNADAGRERIPASIITRPPTAELRDDQRDDQSLPPYEELDPILEAYVERDLGVDEIVAQGLGDPATVRRIARLVDLAEYKRRQAPPGLKLNPKAFGRDRRVPITNRFRPAASEGLRQQEDVQSDDHGGNGDRGHRGGAPVHEAPHQVPVAAEHQERDQGERDPEAQHDL